MKLLQVNHTTAVNVAAITMIVWHPAAAGVTSKENLHVPEQDSVPDSAFVEVIVGSEGVIAGEFATDGEAEAAWHGLIAALEILSAEGNRETDLLGG
jgi:hypothetical protein